MQLGVTTWTLPYRGPKALQLAAKYGFDFVHMDFRDTGNSTVRVRDLRSVSRDTGVELTGMSVNRLEAVGLLDISSAKSAILESIDLAFLLGVNYVYLPFFGLAEIDEGNVSTAALLADFASARAPEDLTIGIESGLNVTGIQTLFAELGPTKIQVLFDTQNPTIRGIDNIELARAVAPYLGSFVHVKDGRRRLGDRRIGRGAANLRRVIRVLVESGFRGKYVLENDYQRRLGQRTRFDQATVRRFVQEVELSKSVTD